MYKAFTLIEVLVVILIVTSIGAFVVPVTLSSVSMSRSDGVANQISSLVFKQQQDAYSGYMDSEFGIRLNNNSITLYRGTSFSTASDTRTVSFPTETITYSLNPSVSDIHFEKGSLEPSSSGSIYVNSSGKITEIVVNSEGLIYVNK